MKTPNGRAEIEAMFGNPANSDGTLNEAWEGANIRRVAPPDGWRLFYQADTGLIAVSSIRMHRLLEDTFLAVMDDIWNRAATQLGGVPTDDDIRAWLHQRRLDQHGGGFNFRKITAGSKLSLHAYGIAIDWDPEHNLRKKPLTRTLPDWWYDIWVRAVGVTADVSLHRIRCTYSSRPAPKRARRQFLIGSKSSAFIDLPLRPA